LLEPAGTEHDHPALAAKTDLRRVQAAQADGGKSGAMLRGHAYATERPELYRS